MLNWSWVWRKNTQKVEMKVKRKMIKMAETTKWKKQFNATQYRCWKRQMSWIMLRLLIFIIRSKGRITTPIKVRKIGKKVTMKKIWMRRNRISRNKRNHMKPMRLYTKIVKWRVINIFLMELLLRVCKNTRKRRKKLCSYPRKMSRLWKREWKGLENSLGKQEQLLLRQGKERVFFLWGNEPVECKEGNQILD